MISYMALTGTKCIVQVYNWFISGVRQGGIIGGCYTCTNRTEKKNTLALDFMIVL